MSEIPEREQPYSLAILKSEMDAMSTEFAVKLAKLQEAKESADRAPVPIRGLGKTIQYLNGSNISIDKRACLIDKAMKWSYIKWLLPFLSSTTLTFIFLILQVIF
jgi:hypothetical protein